MNEPKELFIYQATNGAIEHKVDAKTEAFWATQAQISQLFDIDRTSVTRHIKNILDKAEVDSKSNVQKLHIANSDNSLNTQVFSPEALTSLTLLVAKSDPKEKDRMVSLALLLLGAK